MRWATQTGLDLIAGKSITAMHVDCHKLVLRLDCGHVLVVSTGADCCSETWFSDIEFHGDVFDQPVTEIRAGDVSVYDVNDGRCRQEFDEVYAMEIWTAKGSVDVFYRNSSNGYYGGWISAKFADEPVDLSNLTPVTGNWKNTKESN